MNFKEKTRNHINNEKIFFQLEKYHFLIEKMNKVINLTGFSGDRLWKEGIYESIISLETSFGKNVKGELLDIGAGAGFPSVPYLIANPDINLTIFEPQQKRIGFLEMVKKELKLNIKLICTRVEDFKKKEIFDFVTARAVSSLKSLLRASIHVARVDGVFSFIKGPKYIEEINEAKSEIEKLNLDCKVEKLNLEKKDVFLVKIIKKEPSPNQYPMSWKDIKS